MSLCVPLLNGRIIDFIVTSQKGLLYKAIICFFLANATIIILNLVRNRFYIKLQTNTAFSIISKLIKHIQELPLSIIDTFDIGYLNQKINNDSNSVTTFVIELVGSFTTNIITLFFSIYILIEMSYQIGLAMLGIGCIYIELSIVKKDHIFHFI